MQFIIFAYDGKDKDALSRRMSVRKQHLENMEKLNEEGHVICAGGMTGEDGSMMGSFLVMECDSEDDLNKYLETEPYMTGDVWKDITIEDCNVVYGRRDK